MQILWMLVPLVLFYASFKIYDIFVATAVLMASSTISMLAQWLKNRTFAKHDLIAWFFILVFGSLTLLFHNDLFVKWKPTILFAIMGMILLGNRFLQKQPISFLLLGERVDLSQDKWQVIDLSFAFFYGSMSVLNLFIFQFYSNDTWALFKAFGILGLSLVFTIAIGVYIAKQTTSIHTSNE